MAADVASTYIVEPGLTSRLGSFLRDRGLAGRAFVITDERVAAHHGESVMAPLTAAGFEPALNSVMPNELSKTLSVASELYEWLASERAERRDAIVALGGGLVGDLAGFVAATYLRGLALIQVPTTLLAQVDSSIGGKTGVNLGSGKNLVGAWHLAHTIAVDPLLLRTLPRRQVISGWVETIKHALIMDAPFVDLIEERHEELLALEPEITAEAVERSGRLKVAVVEEDPREQGRRIILNYGHTIGHAIEAATEYRRFLHGEAVAIGLRGAAAIGEALGVTPAAVGTRQRQLLERFGLPQCAADVDRDAVAKAMQLDKKVEARRNRWVLLQDVACPVVRGDVPEDVVAAAIDEVL